MEVCPTFEINEHNIGTIRDIFSYCMGIPGKLNPRKGLWLWGSIGTGKSTLLQIIKKFDADIKGSHNGLARGGFRISNAVDVCGAFSNNEEKRGGVKELETYIKSERQAFDEVGSEAIPSFHYREELNVIQHILQMRYDRRWGTITHITTNMRPDEIAGRYGERIYDRCIEMFNFVELDCYSFRH